MSSVKELFNSRVGSSATTQGGNVSRVFHVTIDSPDDDPRRILLDDFPLGMLLEGKRVLAGGGVRGGTTTIHWGDLLQVSGATVTARLNPLLYECRLDYTPFSISFLTTDPVLKGWEVSMTSVSDSVERFTQTDNITPLGQRKYVVADSEVDATSFVKTRNAEGKEKQVWLKRIIGNSERITTPESFDVNGAQITIRRDVPNLDVGLMGQIASFKGMANHATFLGAGPGFMRFTDYAFLPNPAGGKPLPGNTPEGTSRRQSTGLSYSVSLSFLWRSIRWQPRDIIPTWEDELTGDRIAIKTKNGAVGDPFDKDTLDVYLLIDMNALLAAVIA